MPPRIGLMVLLQVIIFCCSLKVFHSAPLLGPIPGELVKIYVGNGGFIQVSKNGTLSSNARQEKDGSCFRKLRTSEDSVYQFQMLGSDDFLQVAWDGEVFVEDVVEGSGEHERTYDEFVVGNWWTEIYINSDRLCSLAFDRETGNALNACERNNTKNTLTKFYVKDSPYCFQDFVLIT